MQKKLIRSLELRITWCKVFTAPRSNGWRDMLLLTRLLFTVPVSIAKLGRMFSKLERVRTNFRGSLGVKCLENISKIMKEGSSWESFDPISAIKKWSTDRVRGTTKEKKDHVATSHVILLKWKLHTSVMMIVMMREKYIWKKYIVTKKDIFFLLIPTKILIKDFLVAKWAVNNYVILH